MAQAALNIYTAPATQPHYTADMEAQLNRARFGAASGILQADTMLAASKISDNAVEIDAGMYSNQGYLVSVETGGTETLSVDSGTLGAYRHDLIVSDFTRGGGDVDDTHVISIVKGTPADTETGATDPALADDDLTDGGTHRQEAIYRLKISGATLATIERVAGYAGNFYA